MEEGFVASRIDGKTTIENIAHLVGKSKEQTEQILERLRKVGVLEHGLTADLPRERAPAAPISIDGAVDYGDFVFPPVLMHEDVGLDNDGKKRIIWFHE